MKALPSFLKQSLIAIIAAASLVNWSAPSTHIGSAAPLRDGYFGRRPADEKPRRLDSASALMNTNPEQQSRVRDAYSSFPLRFEINHGQADSQVQFISRGNGYDLFITPTEALLASSRSQLTLTSCATPPLMHMKLVGANFRASAFGLDELACKSNYIIGNDPRNWHANVSTYSKVKCKDVYPGVDLDYYGSGAQLEYDFIVSPGASYQDIKIHFVGADKATLDDGGDLVIGTANGEVHHRRPLVYQESNGIKEVIAARYALKGSCEVAFEIGAYDADRPLIIDPVLSYATYFGSATGTDSINGITFDAAGNAYVIGTTASPDLPITPGALQPVNRFSDAFIAKLNAAGTAVLYATYLGGGSSDNGVSIAVDDKGNAYVTGTTYSTDFPTTANAFQRGPIGPSSHAFVAKLNASGTALVYATYLGSSKEIATGVAIAVDAAGQATIAGTTDSPRFPATPGALQPASGGNYDAFVARLNVDGSALAYATYLGGASYDFATCLTLDLEGNAYIAGRTGSIDFPTTRHAYQRDRTTPDASFVAKISAGGDRLVYSTFLGGDQALNGIAVDANGNVYVTGDTSLPTLLTTPDALQPVPAGGFDAFVMKLNNTGSELVYSTFIGGSGRDLGNAIAVDSLGQAYVTGSTTSADFPLMRPLQSGKRGGPLFKSIDGGGNWDDVPGLAFDISSLAVDPQVASTLYASTFTDIIRSTDAGDTWRVIAPRLTGSIVVDPRPAILYVFSGRSIHKSTDAGATWQRTDFPIDPVAFIRTLVIDPKRPDILYFGQQRPAVPGGAADARSLEQPPFNALFKSTDAGTSWVPVDFGRPVAGVSFLAIDPRNTSTIYAGPDSEGLFKSTDDGASWFRPNSTPIVSQLVIDPTNSATLYTNGFSQDFRVSGGFGILKSTNGGVSWGPTALQRGGRSSLAIDPETPLTLYAGNADGLYKTTDGGASWRLSLERVIINTIIIDPKHPATIYAPTNSTSDVFVAKLNATGTALVYSTFLGGFVEDSAMSIAVDPYGNAYVAGVTYSANFPATPNAYRPRGAPLSTGFVVGIADPISPRITNATIKGKKLLIAGEGFDQGAVIRVNDTDLETQNDDAAPSVILISRRGGKQIGRGQTVSIRVRNADGRLSGVFTFIRSVE